MKKSKIIISSYDDIKNPYYGGGGAIAIHELAKRLKDTYEVKVITWNHSGIKKEILDGVVYERIGRSLNPKFGMLVFQLSLPFVAIGNESDVWLESYAPPFTTSFLPLFKKQVVGIVHMLASEDMTRKYGKFPFALIEKIGIRRYKDIVTTNEHTKNKIIEMSKKTNVEVIANGVEQVYRLKTKKTKNVLYLGRIEVDQKGIDLLLSAFRRFVDSGNKDYKLTIAGSGTSGETRKLVNLIKKYNLKKFVALKGKVEGKIKNNLLDRASLIVIPSRFETYSIVALEAMAHGLPIVCFDIEGLKWVNKKAAVKVERFNVGQLAETIGAMLKNKKKLKEMGEYGPFYADNFTWDKIAKKYHTYISRKIANA